MIIRSNTAQTAGLQKDISLFHTKLDSCLVRIHEIEERSDGLERIVEKQLTEIRGLKREMYRNRFMIRGLDDSGVESDNLTSWVLRKIEAATSIKLAVSSISSSRRLTPHPKGSILLHFFSPEQRELQFKNRDALGNSNIRPSEYYPHDIVLERNVLYDFKRNLGE